MTSAWPPGTAACSWCGRAQRRGRRGRPARQRLRVANAGWARWTPVNLVGGAVLLTGNKGRLATQRAVASATVAKATVTGLALGANARRQLTVLQWVIPGLIGTALVLNALMV